MHRFPLRQMIWPLGAFALALLIWAGLMQEFRLDDSFITYRYARNLVQGLGLVYNPGEWVLSTTAPLYAILLAGLSLLIPDFHILGGLFGSLCIALGGLALARLMPSVMPGWVRAWVGLLWILATPLWLALGMETPLWLAFVLWAAVAGQARRWGMAGLLCGLAMLTRPDAALPAGLLGLAALHDAWRSRRWTPVLLYGALASVPVILFYGWAWEVYGSPFPATLRAKGYQAVLGVTGFEAGTTTLGGLGLVVASLLEQSPFYLVMAGLAVMGLARLRSGLLAVMVAWAGLHLLAYVVLGVAPYRWYYLPLLPGLIGLAGLGLGWLARRASPIALGLAVLAVLASFMSFWRIAVTFEQGGEQSAMLPVVDWQVYREAGQWLDREAAPSALVGVSEVGQIGYYARRPMTDYLGLIQPEVAGMLRRGDMLSWLIGYAPDYLVFQRYRDQVGLALFNTYIGDHPWFLAAYAEVARFDDERYPKAPLAIYQRRFPLRPLVEHRLPVTLGSLQLNGWAVEREVHLGDFARLRLDWDVLRADLPPVLQVTLELPEQPTSIKADYTYDTRAWQGAFSTWHVLSLPPTAEPVDQPVRLIVWVIDGPAVAETIGEMTISPDA